MSVIVVGAYGFSNIGDEAMLSIVLKCLQEIYPDEEKIVSCINQDQVSSLHNVKTIDGISPLSMLKNLLKFKFGRFIKQYKLVREMNVLVYGGGSLFNDAKGAKNIGVILLTILMARLSGSLVVLWGVGIGPVYSFTGERILKMILKLSNVIIVRDERSKSTASTLCPGVEVRQGVDLLFSFPDFTKELKSQEKGNDEYLNIGISLRPYPAISNVDYKAIDELVIKALSLVLESINTPKKVKLYGLVFSEGDGRRDDAKMLSDLESKLEVLEISEYFGGFSNHQDKNSDYILSNMLERISTLDIVIGERFHSLVSSIISRTPFIAISYDQKVSELASSIGMDRYCVGISADSNSNQLSTELTEAVESLLISCGIVSSKLGDELLAKRTIAANDRNYIKQKLSDFSK